MKKICMALLLALTAAFVANARPHGPHGGGPRGGFRGPTFYHGGHHYYHHHGGGFWGRGGRNFWPGFVGGVIGSAVYGGWCNTTPVVVAAPTVTVTPPVISAPVVGAVYTDTVAPAVSVAPAPVVQTAPVQQVWVPGRYVDTRDAYGRTFRVWVEGHYETVQTTVVQ